MELILICYLIICLVWTILRYRVNKSKDLELKRRLALILFDFLLYPISYIIFTYTDIIEMIKKDGQKRETKK
jgi:amino acid transporter